VNVTLERGWRELKRAGGDGCGRADARQHGRDVDVPVPRRVRRQAAVGLRELALAADAIAAAGLVPGDRHVDEPLEEVPLRPLGRAPGVLECLVRGKELSAADQVEALCEAVRDRVRRRP
jgi:hypothetical protein